MRVRALRTEKYGYMAYNIVRDAERGRIQTKVTWITPGHWSKDIVEAARSVRTLLEAA